MNRTLSLTDAIKEGRLDDFVAQEEARCIGPISEAEFDETASKVIKIEQSDDQTSRSLPDGGSPKK